MAVLGYGRDDMLAVQCTSIENVLFTYVIAWLLDLVHVAI